MESTGISMRLAAFLTLAMFASLNQAAGDEVRLSLEGTVPMPNVKGRIDHLAVDVKGQRLFVAALANDTFEVLDTATSRHQRSVAGFGEPQGLLYLPETQLLYVANGAGERLDVLDARTFMPALRLEKLADADNVRHNPADETLIVGYGNGALRAIDAKTGRTKSEIHLSGHPESFQVERGGSRIFVNVPSARQIAVADRSKGQVIATWSLSALSNYPMALDETGRRLFVGARRPAALLVHDIDSGKQVARLEVGADADDIFYDAERKRIYVICGEGRLDVVRQEGPDRYVRETTVKTAPGARTGLFSAEEKRLYVAVPAAATLPARILIYSIQ